MCLGNAAVVARWIGTVDWMFLLAGHKIFPESSPYPVPTMDGYYVSQLYPHYSHIFLFVNPCTSPLVSP